MPEIYNITMSKFKKISIVKEILFIVIISMLGFTGIVFTVLYIDTFDSGFWYDFSNLLTAVCVGFISAFTVLTITFFKNEKSFIYKLCLLVIVCISILMGALYFLKISGFLDKIDSVEKFREYIESFGNFAIFLFIAIQFLQVVVLPIPSFITVGAGVLLFGPFKGALFSCIGIIVGSIVAFYIGRIFGFKVAKWLVGEANLKKGLNTIKGKDRIVLTFMFLFPFFPDDVLCFVAGITTMSSVFFIIMIFITRIISVFTASYSMNNSIIPYNTWWGILLWILFFALTIILTVLIYKKGEKFEKIFKRKKK